MVYKCSCPERPGQKRGLLARVTERAGGRWCFPISEERGPSCMGTSGPMAAALGLGDFPPKGRPSQLPRASCPPESQLEVPGTRASGSMHWALESTILHRKEPGACPHRSEGSQRGTLAALLSHSAGQLFPVTARECVKSQHPFGGLFVISTPFREHISANKHSCSV